MGNGEEVDMHVTHRRQAAWYYAGTRAKQHVLLLCALHATSLLALLLLCGIAGKVRRSGLVREHWVNLLEVVDVVVGIVVLDVRGVQGGWESLLERGHGALVQLCGELDVEYDEEVALLHGVLEHRHALALDGKHHALCRRLAGVRQGVERGALGGLEGLVHLLCRGAVELRLAVLHAEGANTLAPQLALGDDGLELVHIVRVRLGNGLEVRAVHVEVRLPLHLVVVLEGVEGHGLHHLARLGLDEELAAVEVGELHAEAAERLHEGDLALHIQIRALALELRVWLLLQHEDNVAGDAAGDLVRLLVEGELVPIGRALRHDHLHDLLHLLGGELTALAIAGAASLLHLLDHRTHADHADVHSLTTALAASGHGALLDHLTAHAQLARLPHVNLLKGHGELVYHVLALLHALGLPPTTAASRKDVKEVSGPATAAAATVLEALLAEAVVCLPLVGVRKNFVGLSDVLEDISVTALVRVVLGSHLAVLLLNVGGRCVLVHLEELVVLGVVHLTARAAAAAGHIVIKSGETAPEEHGKASGGGG
mmetsp:Transcript_24545/g.66725  ORF Transcript_24545/g.66725 Transcript_24545/m.66725 type:complete len:541 (+) Transcript_24545:434-2056(+)